MITQAERDESFLQQELRRQQLTQELFRRERREKIAIAALQCVIHSGWGPEGSQQCARRALEMADALIAELDKEQGGDNGYTTDCRP